NFDWWKESYKHRLVEPQLPFENGRTDLLTQRQQVGHPEHQFAFHSSRSCPVPVLEAARRAVPRGDGSIAGAVASFSAGTRYHPGHLTEFCKKCNVCFISTAVS